MLQALGVIPAPRLSNKSASCASQSEVLRIKSIITYAFLDSGSNTTFCTNELLDQLGVNGRETLLSLTMLQHEDCITKCRVVLTSLRPG